jgi:polyphosphate kinase 2 (PPK2 family)
MKRNDYEQELHKLQAELCKLQDWGKYKGLRVMIIFEGRDAAGGELGSVKRIADRIVGSPEIYGHKGLSVCCVPGA